MENAFVTACQSIERVPVANILSKDDVIKLASLSSLSLREQEVSGVVQQLNDVLGYAVRVGQIVTEVPDTRHARVNVFRDDVAGESCGQTVLAGAPETQEHYFVVPAVLESK